MVDIAFWVLAVAAVISALAVVLLRNVFRAAISLVLCFFTVAGIYIILNADFLAGVQVLIYIGAIAVLLIFGIMLTRGVQRGNLFSRTQLPALVIALLVLATVVSVIVGASWPSVAGTPEIVQIAADQPTTEGLATALFDKEQGFVLPFEVASVLLLAAIIGAIVLVK